jgi:hypothetical protein
MEPLPFKCSGLGGSLSVCLWVLVGGGGVYEKQMPMPVSGLRHTHHKSPMSQVLDPAERGAVPNGRLGPTAHCIGHHLNWCRVPFEDPLRR